MGWIGSDQVPSLGRDALSFVPFFFLLFFLFFSFFRFVLFCLLFDSVTKALPEPSRRKELLISGIVM